MLRMSLFFSCASRSARVLSLPLPPGLPASFASGRSSGRTPRRFPPPGFQLQNLSFQTVGVLPDGIRQRLLLLPVALHGCPEVLEVRQCGSAPYPLGFQRRFRSFQLRHLSVMAAFASAVPSDCLPAVPASAGSRQGAGCKPEFSPAGRHSAPDRRSAVRSARPAPAGGSSPLP